MRDGPIALDLASKDIDLRLYYNVYFPGGLISMPNPLHSDGLVDYEDGTPCTKSQMAKDVVNFLCSSASQTLSSLIDQLTASICHLIILYIYEILYHLIHPLMV